MIKIGIIDFVSPYSKYVFEIITRTGVQYDIFEPGVNIEELEDYDGFVFTGSMDTVYDGGMKIDEKIFALNKPILGICYGHQLIHYMLGGEVKRSKTPENGNYLFRKEKESPLFKGLPKIHQIHMSHNDEVTRMAEGFEKLGFTRTCRLAATQNTERKLYTLQFHPETFGNDYGLEIYKNFMEVVENEKNH